MDRYPNINGRSLNDRWSSSASSFLWRLANYASSIQNSSDGKDGSPVH